MSDSLPFFLDKFQEQEQKLLKSAKLKFVYKYIKHERLVKQLLKSERTLEAKRLPVRSKQRLPRKSFSETPSSPGSNMS
jgi:hypothetical protein